MNYFLLFPDCGHVFCSNCPNKWECWKCPSFKKADQISDLVKNVDITKFNEIPMIALILKNEKSKNEHENL